MKRISVEQIKEMILFTAEKMIESKPILTEVDSQIGDGDHGIGIAAGFTAVRENLEKKPCENVSQLFRETGMAMLNSMGGASGVIFSAMFLGAVQDGQPKTDITIKDFKEMMEKGLEKVKARGKAQVGDKTMVDALEPACRAMNVYSGDSFQELLSCAYEAAFAGVEETKKYVAKFGRAKSLMERAVGFQDAGATSVMLMFEAMMQWAKKEEI